MAELIVASALFGTAIVGTAGALQKNDGSSPPQIPSPDPEPDAGDIAKSRAMLEAQRVKRRNLRIPRQMAAESSTTGLRIL